MADSGAPLTPEKRLLNLIESGANPEALKPQQGAASASAQKRPEPAVTATPEWISGDFFQSVLDKIRGGIGAFKGRLTLKTANLVARAVLIVFILGVIGNAGYEHYVAGKNPLDGLDAPLHSMSTVNLEEEESGQSGVKAAESRNVFLPFAKREEAQPVVEKSGASVRLVEMTKMLKLTGISFNPEDEAATYCMIEDLAKNITIFLRTGDRISGLKVNKIREESVELEYENEKIEIR